MQQLHNHLQTNNITKSVTNRCFETFIIISFKSPSHPANHYIYTSTASVSHVTQKTQQA